MSGQLPLSNAARVQPRVDLMSAEVNREVLLMSLERGCYFALDDVGSELWRRLSGRPTVGELIDALTSHYRGNPAVIEAETRDFLGVLRDHGLLDLED